MDYFTEYVMTRCVFTCFKPDESREKSEPLLITPDEKPRHGEGFDLALYPYCFLINTIAHSTIEISLAPKRALSFLHREESVGRILLSNVATVTVGAASAAITEVGIDHKSAPSPKALSTTFSPMPTSPSTFSWRLFLFRNAG